MKKIVAISAGHHKERPGASYRGTTDKFVEHDEAVMWQKIVAAQFSPDEVFMVPPGTLPAKVLAINTIPNVACAVEIHFNAAIDNHGRHVGKGSETLYCPGSFQGLRLARLVQQELSEVFFPDRGFKEGWYRMDRPGIEDYRGDKPGDEVPDYFLKATKMPAIIVEPDFVHRYVLIRSQRFEGGEAIARGIKLWLKKYG